MVSFTDGAQWESSSAKLQPVNITLDILHDTSRAAETDDLNYSINYSSICKTIVKSCESRSFDSVESLHDHVRDQCFQEHDDIHEIRLDIQRTRGLLHPATTAIKASAKRGETSSAEELLLSNLEVRTIVGINQCEREETQLVRFDILVHRQSLRSSPFPFRTLERRLRDVRFTYAIAFGNAYSNHTG